MRLARGLVLVLAAASAAGAAMIVRKVASVPPPVMREAPSGRVEVLVAGRPIAAGERVEAKDLRWRPWPADAVPSGATQRRPGAPAPAFEPAPARYPLIEGEPVAAEKLARSGDGGVMAGLIAPGMRAAAVPVREDSAVGGLIQPRDRVDVLWTPQAGEAPGKRPQTRTLLRGAKVLAIGRATEAGGRGAEGRTATLELTPAQARLVAGARAGGEISLALIPAADVAEVKADSPEDAMDDAPPPAVKIMKFGRQPDAAGGFAERNR
jgi:pilus assembly protein CpaB